MTQWKINKNSIISRGFTYTSPGSNSDMNIENEDNGNFYYMGVNYKLYVRDAYWTLYNIKPGYGYSAVEQGCHLDIDEIIQHIYRIENK